MQRIIVLSIILAGWAAAQWATVPKANFQSLQLSQFADHELEVPYFLYHFSTVANAVVETGENRGFLDLKVNREPVDNQLYNARIMEMQCALAYFYTCDRPWNPYRGSVPVRQRLEAMLDRWTRIQNQPGSADGNFDGLFAEYSATNWSLAPTGFAVRAAAEALDLIVKSGLPFDPVILEASRVSLRRALMALFTRADMRAAARQYSNQFNGSYHAALVYLEIWPDAELDTVFVAAVEASAGQDQSVAGFWYEQGGPDFGYSSVHENNLRIALPRLRERSDLLSIISGDELSWSEWLLANHVPQPGNSPPLFLVNGSINTRTNHSIQRPVSRPLSEFVGASRAFATADSEFVASRVTRRSQVQSQFGNWGALAVPSSSSYIPAFVFDANRLLDSWHPSLSQRDAAFAMLPCLIVGSSNQQYQDPLPTTFTYVKRPRYYAAVTTGNIRISRQAYGLGLLWNPDFGIALQSVAGTLSSNNRVYGTKRPGMNGTYETSSIPATFTVGDQAVTARNGFSMLPSGDLGIHYTLPGYGNKSITLGESFVSVTLSHSGAFTEMLPLAFADDAVLNSHSSGIELHRPNGSSFRLEVTTPGASINLGSPVAVGDGLVRRAITISASESLSYQLNASGAGGTPPVVTQPAYASVAPGNAVDLDLRTLVSDQESSGSQLWFSLGAAENGSVSLLADGFTARFTAAPDFTGTASFPFVVRDQRNDPRLILHERFEIPNSVSSVNAEISLKGTGAATFEDEAPAGFPVGERRSLRLLTADSASHAHLRTNLPATTHSLSNQDWSASFWYRRASVNTSDFLFYIGSGNGLSGDGHELEVFAPANTNRLQLNYWDGSNVRLANLTSTDAAPGGQWHHAAVVWKSMGNGNGTITLYLNGVAAGSHELTAAFKQDSPLVFGGTLTTAPDPRNHDGWLDDVALYASALGAEEIAGLATRPVANQAGQEAAGFVDVQVSALALGLAGHWTFDGTFNDISGRARHLLPAGAAVISSNRMKQGTASLDLTGSGDYALTSTEFGDAFSLSSWIYLPSGTTGLRSIASNSAGGYNADGFRFFVNSADGKLVLETGNGSQAATISSTSQAVALDRWQHVVMVADRAAGIATVYCNGLAVAAGSIRNDFFSGGPLRAGAMTGGVHSLRGSLDDLRLYSRLINAEDIVAIRNYANRAPQLVAPSSFTLAAGGSSEVLPVTIHDEETMVDALELTVSTSNPSLLPLENIVLGGSASARTIIVRPVAWGAGQVTVTLTVSDGLAATEASFEVTVTNNGHPAVWIGIGTLSPLPWSEFSNWSSSEAPFPGSNCALDFLPGVELPLGNHISQQDMANPFAANRLTLGGSGSAGSVFSIQGNPLSLVANGMEAPAIMLEAIGELVHRIEIPLQFDANVQVSGDGSATFDFRESLGGSAGLMKSGSSRLTLSAESDYTGFTNIQSGVVCASHAGALGTTGGATTVQGSTALATLEISGGISIAEPLQLVMHNTPGHIQLRSVAGDNLLTSSLSLNSGGGRWDISCQDGSLTVAGPVVNISGGTDTWRTLYLHGPAGGSFTNSMSDSASGNSKLNVNVRSGRWHFGNTSKSYTGTTVVSGGWLDVDSSMTSAITVQSGGTFSGSGSTSRDLMIETGASIAVRPGDWASPPGAFAAARVVGTSASAWTVRLDVTGLTNFSETPVNIPFLIAAGGMTDIKEENIVVDASGFPGTGSWSVSKNSGILSLIYTPDLYAGWTVGIDWNGSDSSSAADPDSDGLTNLLEYALGSNPLRGDGGAPSVAWEMGGLQLSFQRVADPKLRYEIIGTHDLLAPVGTWQVVWSSTGAANTAGHVTVHDIIAGPLSPQRFLRLRVTR